MVRNIVLGMLTALMFLALNSIVQAQEAGDDSDGGCCGDYTIATAAYPTPTKGHVVKIHHPHRHVHHSKHH